MHAYQHGGVPEQKTPIWSAVRLNRAVLILTVVGIVTHFALIPVSISVPVFGHAAMDWPLFAVIALGGGVLILKSCKRRLPGISVRIFWR